MENLTKMLNDQKDQIEKELKEIDSKEWDLKFQRSKLTKILKAVNKQIETANEHQPLRKGD
jgi:hypothetical protein